MRRGITLFWLAWVFACLMGTSLVSGGTVRYTYDDAGRLVQADYGDYVITYNYDDEKRC